MGTKILKNEKVLLLVLLLFVGFFYKGLLGGFFQQDEWFSFTIYLLHKNLSFFDSLKFFFAPNISHYNPLTVAAQQGLFSIWGMDYTKFASLGIILHLAVVTMLYFFAKTFFAGNRVLAFITALLFGILASAYQATSWVVADISTLSATLLGLFSSILFFIFLRERKNKFLAWSLATLLVSLLFKEITIGLFPFFFTIYLFRKKEAVRTQALWAIAGLGALYLLFRVGMLFSPNMGADKLVTQSQSMSKLVYNFATVPLKVLSQSIFPIEFVKGLSLQIATNLPEKYTGIPETPEFEKFVVKRVMEALSIGIALLIIALVGLTLLRKKDSESRALLIYALGWIIINSFIFSFSPEQPNVIFAVDSRNLYFTGVGVAIFIVTLLNYFAKKNQLKFLLLVFPVLIFNGYWLEKSLSQFIERGITRKHILREITNRYPSLPRRVIFYTQSDTSYYGLPESEKIFPFQSGMGQTLLVWYFQKEMFPDEFYRNRFLWEITDQGYMEKDSRGFGYFRDIELLKKALKEYNLPKDSVIAFRWNSVTEGITEITEETRKGL